jgi:L-amino acid N-acyltransferase YncA
MMDEQHRATLLSILLDELEWQSGKLNSQRNPNSCLPNFALTGSNRATPRPYTSPRHQPDHLELQCHPESHSVELALSTKSLELDSVPDSTSNPATHEESISTCTSSTEMSSKAAAMALGLSADISTLSTVKQPLPAPTAVARPFIIPGFDPNKYGKPKAVVQTKIDVAAGPDPTQSLAPSLPDHSGIHPSTITHSTIDDSTLATPQQLEASASSTFQTTCSEPDSRCSSEPQVSAAAAITAPKLTATEVESTLLPHTVFSQLVGATPLIQPKSLYLQVESQVKSEFSILNPSPPCSQPVRTHSLPWARSHLPHTQGRSRGPLTPASNNMMNSLIQSRENKLRQQATTGTPTSTFNGSETASQKLARLQARKVSEIRRRTHRRDREDTASPATLAALRLPLSPDKEQKVAERVSYYQDYKRLSSQPQLLEPDLAVPKDPPISPRSLTLKQNPQSQHFTSTATQEMPRSPKPLTTNIKAASKDTIGYYVPPYARSTQAKHNPRWVSNADIKPRPASPDSNAWGSINSNLAAADSDASVLAVDELDVRYGKKPVAPDTLMQWDGKLQPPPVDWADRPRFDNKNPDFKEAFNQWGEAVLEGPSLNPNFHTLDEAQIDDISLHPDGIGMVARNTTITPSNAVHYGYSLDHKDPGEERTTWDIQPLTDNELNQNSTVDVDDPQNQPIFQECTETIVQRYLAHNDINFNTIVRNETLEIKDSEVPQKKATKPQKESHPYAPKVAIYIRPAVKTDLSQMLEIYNWHVENGPRTAEFSAATDEDMRGRLDHVETAKLPLIVAVSKATRRNRYKQAEAAKTKVEKKTTSSNTDSDTTAAIQRERILGWASAQDFTTQDFVERTSAELEIYVDPKSQHLGVGRCLLDKLLEACDRGYLKKGGCDFNCAPERRHLYISGGGRDLHKLYFAVRTWNRPKQQGKGKPAEEGLTLHQEDDYEVWLKAWLERNDFEVEGRMKKVGAKNGRL